MSYNTSCINLLDQLSSVEVGTPLGWFYIGPHNLLWYTFIQGAFTVLAIKEVVSIASVCVRGRSLNLDIRRVIGWNMVVNWEDLRKMFQRIVQPCAKDAWVRIASCFRGDNSGLPATSSEYKKDLHSEPLVSRRGWALVVISGLIALGLFLADLTLVVLSAPSLGRIDASQVQTMTWANNAPIPTLNESNVLRGSFSRTITKEAVANDVEFSSQASVSLERTYFDDFSMLNAKLPEYNGTFLTCDASERWRIVCKIFTKDNLYQYKLRLDTSTISEDGETLLQYFVPVDNFSINETSTNTRSLAQYLDAMEKQLGIKAYVGWSSSSRWIINSDVQPASETIIGGEKILTHDLVASIILGSIDICPGTKKAVMFRRPRGQRQEILEPIHGTVARSQRPRAPLLATIFAYGFLALLSGVLQWKRRVGDVAKDFDIVLEVLAKRKSRAGVLNIHADPLPVVFSFADGRKSEFSDEEFLRVHEDSYNPEQVILTHAGFIPARAMAPLASYMRDRETLRKEDEAEFKKKWDIL